MFIQSIFKTAPCHYKQWLLRDYKVIIYIKTVYSTEPTHEYNIDGIFTIFSNCIKESFYPCRSILIFNKQNMKE